MLPASPANAGVSFDVASSYDFGMRLLILLCIESSLLSMNDIIFSTVGKLRSTNFLIMLPSICLVPILVCIVMLSLYLLHAFVVIS